MIEKEQIQAIAEEFIQDPLFLVEVNVQPGNTIVVEIDSDEAIGVDQCMSLSRNIESRLDRESEDFSLEVGSAGLTSPFRILRQYKKYLGQEVEVLTKAGQKLSGILKDANEENFTITIVKKK